MTAPIRQAPRPPENPYERYVEGEEGFDRFTAAFAWSDGFDDPAGPDWESAPAAFAEGAAARKAYDTARAEARQAGLPLHTPGPWEVADEERNERLANKPLLGVYIRKAGEGMVAKALANCLVHIDDEVHANASLMAAAPDLLEAARREQEWRDRDEAGELDPEWDYEMMVGQYRRAAIAKAEGRP